MRIDSDGGNELGIIHFVCTIDNTNIKSLVHKGDAIPLAINLLDFVDDLLLECDYDTGLLEVKCMQVMDALRKLQ